MSIVMSEVASWHAREYLKTRGHGLGVRLLVFVSGCSELSYELAFVDEEVEGDFVFESNGVRIYIDHKLLVYAEGVEIGFSDGKDGSGFFVNNPKQEYGCGCSSRNCG